MGWLRVDDNFPEHEKCEDLSDLAFALWLKCGCWAAKPKNRKLDGFIPKRVALGMLRSGPEAAEAAASELVEARGHHRFGHEHGLWLVDDDGWRFHNWQRYQARFGRVFEAGSEAASEAGRLGGLKSAEKRRQKHGSAQPLKPRSGPEAAASRNPEAVSSRSGTEARDPGPDPDPDPDLDQDPPCGPPAGGKRKPAKRKHRLPEDWGPKPQHEARAKELGLDLAVEAEKFRDHHLACGTLMVDWDRAFFTWLRNAVEFARRRRPAKSTDALFERARRLREEEEALDAEGSYLS